MAMIRKLSHDLIGFIAAGEVVERPVAAIKELVENSIDAGATQITVEIKEGGIDYFRVSDNGCGIEADQLRMAFERHATSKITKVDDLFAVETLGFRGEALHSIAAVGKVSLTTRTKQDDFGTCATVNGGEIQGIQKAASPIGTAIVVRDLFYNTPVRKKFLKKPVTEAGFVSDYLFRLILSKPCIAFRYVNQGKTIYHSSGDGKLSSALMSIYGVEVFKQLHEIQTHENGVLLHGYLGVGESARGNRQHQSFFVNHRYFRSAPLTKAVEKGCDGQVMTGRFPIFALFLDVPQSSVDVNVHPNKLEVRFQNEQAVADCLRLAVQDCFGAQSLKERLSFTSTQNKEPSAPVISIVSSTKEEPKPLHVDEIQTPVSPMPALGMQLPSSRPVLRDSTVIPTYRIDMPVIADVPIEKEKLGFDAEKVPSSPVLVPVTEEAKQIVIEKPKPTCPTFIGIAFDAYWIFEHQDRLLLMDQHAAHERMLYDRLWKSLEDNPVSQPLLAPLLIRLSAADMALVETWQSTFENMGFDVRIFDAQNVSLHAIPLFFGSVLEPKQLFMETLDGLHEGRMATAEKLQKRVIQMACKHAIKAGDSLSEDQIQGFLAQVLQSDAMPTCPHGRPIVIDIPKSTLDKRFKRM